MATDITYPSSGDGVDPASAPYPALVFARGWLTNASYYQGNGETLASWGYIVAIPEFPDEDIEVRASDIGYLLSYLEAENANSDSPFFGMVDTERFGVTGHSLGGLSAMIVAAQDARVKAAVALDPVNPPEFMGNGTWDYAGEAPDITAPLAVIGAPAQLCNNNANYNDIFPAVGSPHKAKYVMAGGSHCDFMASDNSTYLSACSLICSVDYDEERVQLGERYTVAWFNYYLHADTDAYAYLYGDEAEADVLAGRIVRDEQTAPRDVEATGQTNAVALNWTLYDHPVISGYNVYRRQAGEEYGSTPNAQVGRESSYRDGDVVAAQPYYYVLRSRDAADNEHQPSGEVSAVPLGASHRLYLPVILIEFDHAKQ